MPEVYSEEDYLSGYPKGIERSFWNVARNHLIGSELKQVCSAEDPILDFGCGTGIVTTYLRQQGFNCFGVEQGNARADTAQQDFLFLGCNAFELPQTFRHSVKVILLLDVLEHIENRDVFLQRVRESFPECHQFIFTVPARMELWSNFDEKWGHVLRYDLERLNVDLALSGLRAEKSRYYFHLLYLAAAALSLFNIQRSTEFTAPGTGLLSKCFHSLLAWYFVLEANILPGKVYGSSIITVAKAV